MGAVQAGCRTRREGPGLPEDVKKKPLDGVGRTVWWVKVYWSDWSWYISAPKGLGLGLYRALLASEVAPEVRRTVPPL